MTETELSRTVDWYRRFAENEAREKSPLYAQLSAKIAEDDAVIEKLLGLPTGKRQPNLLLASYRWLFGAPEDWTMFRTRLLKNWKQLQESIMTRSTQTNEPGRCAVITPVLATLPQPIALIEVGAAAGLCLYPDRYGYDWSGHSLLPEDNGDFPIFSCINDNMARLPSFYPHIVWRAGLDLNPLDVRNDQEMRWLETLVWPGQEERLARLRQSIVIAKQDPPAIRRGNLLQDLACLLEDAPAGATKVVIHTAVLNYVEDTDERNAFAEQVGALADFWIANEAPGVFPAHRPASPQPSDGLFVLAVNGKPVAWTDPHGAAMWWLD